MTTLLALAGAFLLRDMALHYMPQIRYGLRESIWPIDQPFFNLPRKGNR